MRDGDAGAVEPPDVRQGFRHAAIFGDDRRFGAGVPFRDIRRMIAASAPAYRRMFAAYIRTPELVRQVRAASPRVFTSENVI